MKIFPLLIPTLFCLFLSPTAWSQNTCTNNLLPNPGFENDLNNWTTNGATTTSPDAYSGNSAGSICNGSGSISKALPATPGMEYNASLWAKRTGNVSYANVQLRFLNSSYSPITGAFDQGDIVSSTYTKLEFSSIAPANAAYVHLYIYKATTGCIFLDEAELCEAETVNDCNISVAVSNYQCFDNGTASDPTDDLFSIDITVTNPNGGTGFTIAPSFGSFIPPGDYDVAYTYGPISIADFNNSTSLTAVQDVDDDQCLTAYTLPAASPCSNDNNNGNVDLELSLSQSDASPAIYNTYSVTATLTNTGGETATNPKVAFLKPDGVVYTGSDPYNTSDGAFLPYSNEHWFVDDIAPGESKTLIVNYFLLQNEAPIAYAQVIQMSETDDDSTPNNGTPPVVNEDDEASTDETVMPPNNGDACAFSKTYDNVTGLEVVRSFTAVENAEGSFTGRVVDVAPDGNRYLNNLEVDENGDFVSLNLVGFAFVNKSIDSNGSIESVASYPDNAFDLSRYDLNGDLVWENEYPIDNANDINLSQIKALAEGGFLVLGSYYVPNSSGDFIAFFARIDENGTLLWLTKSDISFHGPSSLYLAIEAKNGGFYIRGRGSAPQYAIIKVTENGEVVWDFFQNGPSYLALNNLSESSDGNFIYWLDESESSSPQATSQVSTIHKYNSSGNEIWTYFLSTYEPNIDIEEARVAALADGGAVISYYERNYPNEEAFYSRLDETGNLVWKKSHPLANHISQETSDGGLLFTGLNNDNTPYLFKTTGDGELTPVCGGLSPPSIDLPCGITYSTSSNSITVSGLSTSGHSIAKLFSPSWQTLYDCLDNCEDPFTVSNLPEGTYHLRVNKYSANWELECSFLEDIVITNQNLQGQDEEQLFFDAMKNDRKVAINWATNTGALTDHFVVEHAKDGEVFSTIITMENRSDSDQFVDYQIEDAKPVLGYNYYRLKQVYKDGTARYSGSKAVLFDKELTKVLAYPNPVETVLHLDLKPYVGSAVELSIFNQLGQGVNHLIFEEVSELPISIDVADIEAGLYFISIKSKNNKMQTLRFVKTRP